VAPSRAPVAKDFSARALGGRGARADAPPRDLIDLARRLIASATTDRGRVAKAVGDEVMLDLEVDGVRCLLISNAAHPSDGPQLSPREKEIVRMVSHGYPNKTIAAVLEISTWTVSTHLRRIFAKLGVRTRAAMVARALESGLAPEVGTVASPPHITRVTKST
jgi:DNA-binding CsgD family transcriptional regulator